MLNTLREKMAIVMWIVVIAFIGTIIFSWGMGGIKMSNPRTKGIIAEINGEEVKYDQYRNIRQSLTQNNRKKELTDLDIADLDQRAWNQLIQMVVISQEIKNNNIEISDAEVYDKVRNEPPLVVKNMEEFKENGKFSLEKYQQVIDNPQKNMEGFYKRLELMVTTNLPFQKLEKKVKESVYISEEMVKNEYLDKHIKASAKYLYVKPTPYLIPDSTISKKNIEDYYKEHQDQFEKTNELRSFKYVLFDTSPQKEDTVKALEDINYLLEQYKNGSSFEELAKNYSEDGSATKGGDLGYFKKGRMVPEFEKAAFNGEVGKVVGPVETKFGYHLIKILDKKIENKEIVEVKAQHILIKFKAYQETINNAKYRAEDFKNNIKDLDFQKAIKKLSLKEEKIMPLSKGDYVTELGRVPGLGDFLFKNKIGSVSKIMTSSKGYLILSIDSIVPSRQQTIEDVKGRILIEIKKELALEKSFKTLKESTVELKDTLAMKEISKLNKNIKYGIVKDVTRVSYLKSIGKDNKFFQKLFNTQTLAFTEPFKGDNAAFVLYPITVEKFNKEDFDGIKASIEESLRNIMEREAVSSWLDGKIKKAEIKDYRHFYHQ